MQYDNGFHIWSIHDPLLHRCWTSPRPWRTGRAPSSWCRCPGWWWSAAARAARAAWSRWATPSRKPSTASVPSSPPGRRRERRQSWRYLRPVRMQQKRGMKKRKRREDTAPVHIPHFVNVVQSGSCRDGHTPVSPWDLGAVKCYHGDLIIGFSTEVGFV